MTKSWKLVVFTVVLSWSLSTEAQEKNPQSLTAREIFYNAKAPAPPPAAAPQRPATAPSKQNQQPVTTAAKKDTPSSPAAPAATASVATVSATAPAAAPASAPASGARLQLASYAPLGLRYSLLRRTGPGQYEEVHPDTTFRSGEGLRVSVESNDPAYLYIVARGSSGAWNVLFPNANINKGDNRIEPRSRYQIPAGGQFTFDQQPGTERVFVILTRTQESDLEGLIYSLNGAPASARPSGQATVKTIAQNLPMISDAMVGKIRDQFMSRDLVFEKVDDVTSDRKEKAVYVVNATGTADGRVLVDLSLRHQ